VSGPHGRQGIRPILGAVPPSNDWCRARNDLESEGRQFRWSLRLVGRVNTGVQRAGEKGRLTVGRREFGSVVEVGRARPGLCSLDPAMALMAPRIALRKETGPSKGSISLRVSDRFLVQNR